MLFRRRKPETSKPFDIETVIQVEGYGAVLEDRAEVIEADAALVIVVADGAGGRSGGAEAAESVVGHVRASVQSAQRVQHAKEWIRLLVEIDGRLVDDPEAGETTAVVTVVTATEIVGASVGDSGAWLITATGYEELTAMQRVKPCLGTGMAVPVPFVARRWQGTLLVASDGLFKYACDASICSTVREERPETAAHQLVDLVRLRSGSLPDDVAVVLCRRRQS